TTAQVRGRATTMPSATSVLMASRTGIRETFSSAAMSRSIRREPGWRRPSMMSSRSTPATRSDSSSARPIMLGIQSLRGDIRPEGSYRTGSGCHSGRMTLPRPELDGMIRLYPADDGPLRGAGLLWAHGGGFIHGDLDMPEADAVSRAFAGRGAVVASVDYRLVGDGSGRFPAGSDDILAAWGWLLAHATELGADPTRLFAGGASAGANLVVGAVLRLLGHAPATASAPPPAGVVLAYPTLLAVQPDPPAALRAALAADPDAD